MRTLRMVALCLLVGGLLSTAAVGFARPANHPISLNLVDADLRDALTMLFRDTDKNFVLAADADPATRVTMKLVGVDFETALQSILRQAGLRAQVAGDVYTILPAPTTRRIEHERETPVDERETPVRHDIGPPLRHDDNTFETSTGEGAEKVTETIKLLYGDAVEIATLFGGPVASGRFSNGYRTGYDSPYRGSWNDPYRGYQQRGSVYRDYRSGSDAYRGYDTSRYAYPNYRSGADTYRGYESRRDIRRRYPTGTGTYY